MPLIQFSGLASGIDSAALIDALVEARQSANELRRSEIEFLESENDALEELNTKILALNELVDRFRTINGGGVKKQATTSDATVATAAAGTTAINSSYTLTVTSTANTATANITHAGTTWTSLDDVFDPNQVADETLTVTVGTGANQFSIAVGIVNGDNMTVQNIIDVINSDPNAAGNVVAYGVNTGTSSSPDYQIVISTLNTGTEKGALALAYTDAAGTGEVTLDDTSAPATDAQFTIDGISGTITRQTNNINDVISGVTFNLQSAGQTTITISDDADSTGDLLQEIVDAFNDLVEFVNENDTVERVESGESATNVFGTLAKTNIDNDVLSRFRTELLSASSSTGVEVTSMSELGLSTNRDGSLSFDLDEFIEAVNTDSAGVGEVLTDFADSVAGTSGVLNQFTKFSGFIDVAQESNNNEIINLNEAIEQLDRQTEAMRESLTLRFARLEQLTAELQSKEQALSGILAGL